MHKARFQHIISVVILLSFLFVRPARASDDGFGQAGKEAGRYFDIYYAPSLETPELSRQLDIRAADRILSGGPVEKSASFVAGLAGMINTLWTLGQRLDLSQGLSVEAELLPQLLQAFRLDRRGGGVESRGRARDLRQDPVGHLEVVEGHPDHLPGVRADQPPDVARDRVHVLHRDRIDDRDTRAEVAHGQGRDRELHPVVVAGGP